MGSRAHHSTQPDLGMTEPCWEPYATCPPDKGARRAAAGMPVSEARPGHEGRPQMGSSNGWQTDGGVPLRPQSHLTERMTVFTAGMTSSTVSSHW